MIRAIDKAFKTSNKKQRIIIMMSQKEQETIQNIIDRLSLTNCGCHIGMGREKLVAEVNGKGIEAVSRLYLESWVILALRLLLPGEDRNVDLAWRLSRR
jgi:hypothetical protein